MRLAAQILLAFVSLYPIVTAAFWIVGGFLFRVREEANDAEEPEGGWPGVTILVPAYNEAAVIAACVEAARAADYPKLEILVLDDGSTDDTAAAATKAGGGDPRVEVVRDGVNRGKAERLNLGFACASRAGHRRGRRHASARAGAEAPRRAHAALATRGRGRRRAARDQPAQPARCAPGTRSRVDHRPDPPYPGLRRQCRCGGWCPRTVPT